MAAETGAPNNPTVNPADVLADASKETRQAEEVNRENLAGLNTAAKAPIGLALSGGGFRATLFHLGVIAYLRQSRQLPHVTHITSVSGGSVAAAHLVLNWERYIGDDDSFNAAASEVISFIKQDIRGRILRRIPLYFPFYWLSVLIRRLPFVDDNSFGWWTRVSTTDILRRYYSRSLFKKKKLIHLRGSQAAPRPRLYLLTTSLDDARQASFTSRGFQIGTRSFDVSLNDLGAVVAASSAFPGMFPSVVFRPQSGPNKPTFRLIDGGVFDNLGVRKFWELMTVDKVKLSEIIVSDASVAFRPSSREGFFEPITTPIKAADILMRRVYDFEKELAEKADRANPECTFRFLRLMEKLDSEVDEHVLIAQYQDELYSMRTDLDVFSDLEIAALVRHGYCVARARLTSPAPDQTASNAAAPEANGSAPVMLPWDPLPGTKCKLARALIERNDEFSDQILKELSRSSVRRFRLVSTRDRASYITGALVVLLIALLSLPWALVYYQNRLAENRVPHTADQGVLGSRMSEAASEYRKILWSRRSSSALQDSFIPDSLGKQPAETWSNAQTVYALLCAGNLKPSELTYLAKTLDGRFKPSIPGNESDWVPSAGGWYTRPGSAHLQAEPALWMLIALSRILQEKNLDPTWRQNLAARIQTVQNYVASNQFMVWEGDQLVVNVLANQKDPGTHSAYSTSLALLALVEMRRANVAWGSSDRDAMINGILRWFNSSYDDNLHSWTSVDNDTALKNTDEGANLQILAIMLRTYAELGLPVPDDLRTRVNYHLRRLEDKLPLDSRAHVWVESFEPGQQDARSHEVVIRFFARPWALILCREWLKIASSAPAATNEIASSAPAATNEISSDSYPAVDETRVLTIIDRLTTDWNNSLELDRDAFTFRSALMTLALS